MSGIALALENYPDADQNDWFEIIEGVKTMAASARFNHNVIGFYLAMELKMCAVGHKIAVVYDVDVHLPDGNIFRPDVSVVTDHNLIGADDKIHGVPELVVEVLSPSTAKNDLGIKMTLYARNGVKEYWIVYPREKSIHVYKLSDGHYLLDDVYYDYTQAELDSLSAPERAEVKDKIPVGIFPEALVDVRQIFRSPFD